jgi:hypothetical protein
MPNPVENFDRRNHLAKCWENSQGHWVMVPIMAAAAIWGLISNYGPLIDSPLLLLVISKIPKLPLVWALIIFLSGLVFILIEGGFRYQRKQSRLFNERIEGLERSIGNAAVWHEWESRFGVLDINTMAIWSHPINEPLNRHWIITGLTDGITQGCQFRAVEAGAILRSSLYVKKNFPELLNEPDNCSLWCNAILQLVGYERGPEGESSSTTEGRRKSGTINNFPNASKLLCLKLAAEERGFAH